jgi:hypothetical protein
VTAAGCVLAAAALGGDAAAAERQELLLAQEQQLLRASNGELVTQRDAARAELAALRQRHGEPLHGEPQPSRQQPEELAQRQQSWEQQRWLRQSERQQGPALPQARGRRAPAAVAGTAAGPAGEPIACREGCGRQFDGVLAEIGHLRHCPVRLARQASRPA